MHMVLLAQSTRIFYLPDVRRTPTTIEFITEAGKIRGLYWTQEKRHECRKTGSAPVSDTVLNSYTGVYQLLTDKKRTITISKKNDYLVGEISGQVTLRLIFQSDTKFVF